MRRFFNLMELIVTIVIISIIAVIVLLNITSLNERAKITSLNADKKNIQLAADKYNLDNGYCPSNVQPKLGNPQPIDFDLLYSDYIKSMPQYKDVYYWVDFECVVYVSLIDAPTDVSIDVPNGTITWTPHEESSTSIIHVKKPNGSIKVVEEDKTGNYDGEDGKEHFVSEEDKYGLDTPPVGEDYTGYPNPSEEDETIKGPIVACDTDGFICIYTAEELASIGKEANFPIDGNFRLANNINLVSYENWEPIMDRDNWEYFSGILDGNGFSINNLTIADTSGYYMGLFYYIRNASVMNLTLEDVNISGTDSTGGITGYSYDSSFKNISINGHIEGGSQTGGIAGYSDGNTFENVRVNSIIKGGYRVGGVAGNSSEDTFKNITVTIEGEGDYNIGGVAGYSDENNYEDISTKVKLNGGYSVGGVAGDSDDDKFINVSASGDIKGSYHLGGVAGKSSYSTIDNAEFNGSIIGEEYRIGGIIGNAYNINATDLKAKGVVEGYGYIGGVFGSADYVESINLFSQSNVISKNKYSGGIAGYASGGTFTNVHSKGNISGDAYVGGLIGSASSTKVNVSSSEGDINSLNVDSTEFAYYGGLIGNAYQTDVIKSLYKGNITVDIANSQYVGGAIGSMWGSNLSNVSIESDINATSTYVGGVVGNGSSAELKYIKYLGDITADGSYVGGLAGYSGYLEVYDSQIEGKLTNNGQYTGGLAGYYSGGNYNRVYSNVFVNGVDNIHINALFGYAYSYDPIGDKFRNIYWNSQLSNQSYSSNYEIGSTQEKGNADITNPITGVHLSLDELKNSAMYEGWDFTSIWKYEDNLPKLREELHSISN